MCECVKLPDNDFYARAIHVGTEGTVIFRNVFRDRTVSDCGIPIQFWFGKFMAIIPIRMKKNALCELLFLSFRSTHYPELNLSLPLRICFRPEDTDYLLTRSCFRAIALIDVAWPCIMRVVMLCSMFFFLVILLLLGMRQPLRADIKWIFYGCWIFLRR